MKRGAWTLKRGASTWRSAMLVWPLAFASIGTCAQPATPAGFEWLARTSVPAQAPLVNVNPTTDTALQWLRGALHKVAGTSDVLVQSHRLEQGRWEPAISVRMALGNKRLLKAAHSLDPSASYVWSYDRGLVVAGVDVDGAASTLFTLSDDRLNDVAYSQRAASLLGDAKHGFWWVNAAIGSAWFIEPGSWTVREVPGLSRTRSRDGSAAHFHAATIGQDGTLWTLEKNPAELVRRDAQGAVQVRVPAPFAASVAQRGVPTFGDGGLAPSPAGVVVLSPTRLALASVDHHGKELWRTSLCPQGERKGCGDVARQRGRLGFFGNVIGDEAGGVYAADGSRVAHLRGATDARMVIGDPPACMPSLAAEALQGSAVSVCVTVKHRAVPLGSKRWLLFTPTVSEIPPIELEIAESASADRGARIQLRPYTRALVDLPYPVKRAVVDKVNDARAWNADSIDAGVPARLAVPAQRIGVPTDRGLVSVETIMSHHLSPPGDAIRTEADQALHAIFGGGGSSASIARLGASGVVIRDLSDATTRVARFDARTTRLERGLALKGLPNAGTCADDDKYDEHFFNDDQDRLYFLRGRTGDVFAVDQALRARLVARFPGAAERSAEACGPQRSAGPVLHALRMPSGDLLLSTGAGLWLQRGASFVSVSAPKVVAQMIPLTDREVLVIAREGLARVTLPK